VVEAIDTATLKGLRDRAIILVGWGALLRRSEIGELKRSDLAAGDRAGWLDLTVRTSKTSDEAAVIALSRLGARPSLCPVEAVTAWLEAAGDQLGPDSPLFPRITRGGRILLDDQGQPAAIDGAAINDVIKARTKDLATAVERYSGHSLRRGGATDRARRGADVMQLERAGRWSPGSAEVRKYIETVNRAEDQGATLLDVELPELEVNQGGGE
jgi:integrase